MSNDYTRETVHEQNSNPYVHLLRALLLFIPIVNMSAAFIWAFAGKNPETRHFGRVVLILFLILFIGAIIFGAVGLSSVARVFESYSISP